VSVVVLSGARSRSATDCSRIRSSAHDNRITWLFTLSINGTEWEKPTLQGEGEAGAIDYLFPKPTKAKSIRISQLGEVKGTYWSIHELQVLGAVKK
jgi:hypothetical protein